ncbi:MAG: hypothetical protein ABMB14_30415 [Myxococcota bacterium]
MWLLTFVSCSLPVDPRPSCARYVACVEARDARDGSTTDVDRFAPDGACWGGEAGADLCDRACTAGLAWLADREPDLGCAP